MYCILIDRHYSNQQSTFVFDRKYVVSLAIHSLGETRRLAHSVNAAALQIEGARDKNNIDRDTKAKAGVITGKFIKKQKL